MQLHEGEQIQPAPDISPGWLSSDEQIIIQLLLTAYHRYGVVFGYRHLTPFRRNFWARLTQLRLLIFLLADLKVGEAVALQVKDLDLERRLLEIKRPYRRTGEVKRMAIPVRSLSQGACDVFRRVFAELRLSDDDFILSGSKEPVRPYVIWRSFKLVARAVGLDPQAIHPETLRQLHPALSERIIEVLLADKTNWKYKHPPRRSRCAEAQGRGLFDF